MGQPAIRDEVFRAVENNLSPLRSGAVFIAAASEPDPASVRPYAAVHSPVASFGK